MSGPSIAEINERHPLNRLALECLDGYGVDEDNQIAALVLLEAWWDDLSDSRLLRQKGGPTDGDVERAIAALSGSKDVAAVMMYLTTVDGEEVLDVQKLREMDGDDIAHEILEVIVCQLISRAPIPK